MRYRVVLRNPAKVLLFTIWGFILFFQSQSIADWGIQTPDGGNQTESGRHCSMALDSADRAHIVYTQMDSAAGGYVLKYTTNSIGAADTWDSLFIDAPPSANVGAFNAVFIDPDDHLHVSYYHIMNGDLIYADSSAWPTWTHVPVDTPGDVGRDTDIVADASGGIHISYYDEGNEALKYAYKPSGGTWSVETVLDFTCSNPSDANCRVGQYTSIGIDSSENPHIVYYENAFGYLKHAWKSSGSWSTETISTIWAEGQTSLVMDGNDLHVSFYSFASGNLMYATNATSTWVVETAHNSSFDVGTYSSIGLDAGGGVHIAYYDETEQDLEYTTRIDGYWMNQTVDGTGNSGRETNIVIAGEQVHIGYYQVSGNNLRYALHDPNAPHVTATVPTDQAPDSQLNHAILVAFSEAMDAATLSGSGIALQDDQNNPVGGTVAYDATSHIAAFVPGSDLSPDTTYTATVATSATDVGGQPMDTDVSFSFTTGSTADSSAPYVESSIPADGAVSVRTNRRVMILFSEEVDPNQVSSSTVLMFGEDLSGGGGFTDAVTGSVTYVAGNRIAVFTPDIDLDENRSYRMTLTSAIADLGGIPLAADHSLTFTTGGATDATPISINTVTPAESATGVLKSATVSILFSEPVNPATLLGDYVSVSELKARSIQYNWYTQTATLTFDTALVSSKRYTATAISGIEDLAGNPLTPGKQWTFTATPGVVSTWPLPYASNVDPDLDREIEATFWGDMDASTIDSVSFFLSRNGTTIPATTVTYDTADRTAKLRIPDTLTLYSGATYTVTLTTAVQDTSGAGLEENYVWEFTTYGTPSDGGSGGCFISGLTMN
jgi:hypothetical protein